MEGEEELQDLPAPGGRPEDQVFEQELRETRERVAVALKKALDSLSPEDRLIVKMSILDNLKIVDIARLLCMEQKPLYRRREKILRQLRSGLERDGVRWEQVSDLLNRSRPRLGLLRAGQEEAGGELKIQVRLYGGEAPGSGISSYV